MPAGLPPKADIAPRGLDGRKVPQSDDHFFPSQGSRHAYRNRPNSIVAHAKD